MRTHGQFGHGLCMMPFLLHGSCIKAMKEVSYNYKCINRLLIVIDMLYSPTARAACSKILLQRTPPVLN